MSKYHFHKHDVKVHEHKAPTDQSVELLRDMEKEALEQVLGRVEVRDNTLNATFLYYSPNYIQGYSISDKVIMRCRFALNGQEHQFELYVDAYEWKEKGKDWYYMHAKSIGANTAITFMAAHIAKELVVQFHKNLEKSENK